MAAPRSLRRRLIPPDRRSPWPPEGPRRTNVRLAGRGLVRTRGFEPPPGCPDQHLKLACLPDSTTSAWSGSPYPTQTLSPANDPSTVTTRSWTLGDTTAFDRNWAIGTIGARSRIVFSACWYTCRRVVGSAVALASASN